jgi:hypothetical protein
MREWLRQKRINKLRKKYVKIARSFIRLIEDCSFNTGYQCAKEHDQREDCPSECVFSPNKEMKVKL